MAITTNQQPAAHTPVVNPQTFESTSTAIGNADFAYRILCTDLITLSTQTYNIKQRPTTGELVFNAAVFSKNFIKNYVPNNVYGFRRCTDAIRKIRINIGEYFSSAYTAGANIDYIIWNGSLRALEWVDYAATQYIYKNSTSNFKYLTSDTYNTLTGFHTSTKKTYADRSHFLYVLSSENNDLEFLRINTYNDAGTLIGEYDIPNQYAAGTTYTDKYVCIDIGHKGLSNLTLSPVQYSVISGSAPIISSSVSYYDVIDAYTAPPATARKNISRFYIECEPTYTVYTLHFKAKGGNFETLHFAKNSQLRERAQKNSYRRNPNTLASNNYAYTKFDEWERTISSTGTESIQIKTDWLTPNQVAFYREIITSTEVYIDYGATIGLVPCKVLTSEILVNQNYNNKMFGINLEIEPTYKNNY